MASYWGGKDSDVMKKVEKDGKMCEFFENKSLVHIWGLKCVYVNMQLKY